MNIPAAPFKILFISWMPVILVTLILLSHPGVIQSQPLPVITPQEAGMDQAVLSRVDQIIEKSISDGETPGAVLLVMRKDRIVWRKAYGNRQITPEAVPMTAETIFDMASITKPVATATSVMQLVDAGKIRLSDPVSHYLPDFNDRVPSDDGRVRVIRVLHLLTHSAGLPSYPPVADLVAEAGSDSRLQVLYNWLDTAERQFAAGESFLYSCPNFVTLQRIVESVTGETLAEYSRKHIFRPLQMNRTGYTPPADWKADAAPTEPGDNGEQMICIVHDPFARELMDGISGNAGLFSTADDLAVFAAMMMNNGTWFGERILSKAAVEAMTRVPHGLETQGRGLGWDLNSSFATNQGDLFGPRTYGHTGFTGTSLIIDPDTETAVILLTNRVHPDGSGNVVRLRSLVANIVAASLE
ncbi:MAG: serine hydrolase domain-containing protein [Cyclonatronaceae bacterium]